MASKTVNFSDSQIYVLARPERSGDAGPYGKWSYHGHSVYKKERLYQGGTSDSSYRGPGIYNGLMMSALKLDAVHSTDNVNNARITLHCYHTYNSTGATINVWVGDNLPASGSTERDPGRLGFSKVGSYSAKKGKDVSFTLSASQCRKRYVIIYTNAYNNGTYYCYFGGAGYGTRPKVTIDYTDKIIPGKPDVGLRGYSGEKIGCDFNGMTNIAVFRGDNNIEVYSDRASNAVKTELHLQWRDKTRSWRYCGGYPYTTNGAVKKSRYYGNNDRYIYGEFDEQYFCAWTVAVSRTGHKTRSDYFYFAINDLPSMTNESLKIDKKITPNEVTLSWSGWKDRLNKKGDPNQWYRLWYRIYRNGNWTDYQSLPSVKNGYEKTLNLSDLEVNRGEKVRFWIEPGDFQEWSGTKYGYVEVSRNVIPSFPSGAEINTSVNNNAFNNVFDGPINITLPKAIDPDDQPINYRLYWKQSSDWNYIATYDTLDLYSIDLTRYINSGETIQLGVIANDTLEDSGPTPGVVSKVMRKNSMPSKPNDITIVSSTHLDNDDHYETIDYITWKEVLQFNGKPMHHYNVQMLGYRRNENVPYITRNYESSTNVFDKVEFGLLNRGDKFRFSVSSVDQYGQESPAFYSNYYYKNSAPAAPKNFMAIGSGFNFKNTITLTWDKSTDIDGDTIRYKLYFSRNRGSFEMIQSNIAQNSYTHDISSLNAGDTLGYKIIAYDKYGVQSPEAYVKNCHELYINLPPTGNTYLYPNENTIYSNKPRIIFRTGGGNKTLTIFITLNGTNYSSSSSASCFSKTNYNGNEYVVFIPETPLHVGLNDILIKTFDGIDYSTPISKTINYNEPTVSKISDRNDIYISAERYNSLKHMIDSTIKAYGESSLCSYNPIANQTLISNNLFLDLYNKILAINKKINTNYPGLNRYPEQYPSSQNEKIFKSVNNIIHDIITKI